MVHTGGGLPASELVVIVVIVVNAWVVVRYATSDAAEESIGFRSSCIVSDSKNLNHPHFVAVCRWECFVHAIELPLLQ